MTKRKEQKLPAEALSEQTRERITHLPRLNLAGRALFDLEMLLNGGFAPLEGFMNEEDYTAVIHNMRLVSKALWPIPIVLDLPHENFKKGEEVLLCDPYGKPLAIFTINSLFRPDKKKEAELVYGTANLEHPGVQYLFEQMGDVYAGGNVEGIALPEYYDFTELRLTPQELRAWFKEKGWDKVVGFQTRNPIHRAHYEIMRRAADQHDARILIHPVVGMTKEGDIDYVTRVRAYKRLHENHMGEFAKLSLLPLAMRMAGPREAVWHALIRKNYGCTHFIVGRDHAGPGKDSSGKPFYGDYDAQQLAKSLEQEIGLTIVPMQEMVYIENEKLYLPLDEVDTSHKVVRISGTEFRRKLRADEDIPAWFSFPEVIEELRKGPEGRVGGLTIFFTGLPSAGKSTIARALQIKLGELTQKPITLLDGDVVRNYLSKGLGFSKADREENIRRIGFVASEVTKHGGIALCAAIAPYAASREETRKLSEDYGTFIEVYVATPLPVCKKRDTKGLYKKAEEGALQNFTGVNDPYEVPENPELTIDTSALSTAEAVDTIIAYLLEHNLLPKK